MRINYYILGIAIGTEVTIIKEIYEPNTGELCESVSASNWNTKQNKISRERYIYPKSFDQERM